MKQAKMQHCFNCGDELGVYVSHYGDIDVCGKRECQREAQCTAREIQAEREERAREDNYERY